MKKLLLIIFVGISIMGYSQSIKSRTVLNKFILGYDNEKTLSEKIQFDELNIYYEYDGANEITKITLDQYDYKLATVKIILIIINDELYSVRYYPKTDKAFQRYIKYLNTEFNILGYVKQKWDNESIEIIYEIDGEFQESFVHYYLPLLKKYPQYKNLAI